MNGFLLRPLDWVSFGEPRPSAASESHHRGTALPPTPTAFQGVIRTALLRAAGLDLADRSPRAQAERDALVGGQDHLPSGWQIRGPFVADVDEEHAMLVPWVKCPRFLLRADKTDKRPTRALWITPPRLNNEEGEGPAIVNDLSPTRALHVLGHPKATDAFEGWLSPTGLRKALSGNVEGWSCADHAEKFPPFVGQERLPGLQVDPNTWTAQDGMLFFSDVIRFKGRAGIAGWLTGVLPSAIPDDALRRGDLAACGWRSRPAALEALPDRVDPDWQHVMDGEHLPKEVSEQDTFFLVALTPVPCTRDPSLAAIERDLAANVALPDGVRVRVLAMMTGKPIVIGGLSAATRRTRPNQSFWDAGSTFLITLRGGDAARRAGALQRLNNTHALGSRGGAGLGAFGYGHTLVGIGAGAAGEVEVAS